MSNPALPKEAMQALDSISASLSDLVAVSDGANRESLQSISLALSEMVQLMEAAQKAESSEESKTAEAMRKIAQAVAGMNLAPQISVTPTINVPSQPLSMTIEAPPVHNHITIDPQQQWTRLKVSHEFKGDQIVASVITREA